MKIQKVLAVKVAIDASPEELKNSTADLNKHLEQGWRVKEISSIEMPSGEGYRSRALSYFILEKNNRNEE